jgi:hypothetical protein
LTTGFAATLALTRAGSNRGSLEKSDKIKGIAGASAARGRLDQDQRHASIRAFCTIRMLHRSNMSYAVRLFTLMSCTSSRSLDSGIKAPPSACSMRCISQGQSLRLA